MVTTSAGPPNAIPGQVDFAKCDCCGLTEECTPSYIQAIRDRYGGKWICGLCAEAVKDEVLRCGKVMISPDEAMNRHLSFCNKFRASGPPLNPTVHLIRAMSQVLRRSLDGPAKALMRPIPNSSMGRGRKGGELTRSESCIPSLTLVEGSVKQGRE